MPTPLGPGLMVDRGNVGGAGRSRRPVTNRIMVTSYCLFKQSYGVILCNVFNWKHE